MAQRCAWRGSRQNGENGATNGDQNARIGREAAVMTWHGSWWSSYMRCWPDTFAAGRGNIVRGLQAARLFGATQPRHRCAG
jgi:hypothetical protein